MALLIPIIVPISRRSLQILAVEDACKLIMAPWKNPYNAANIYIPTGVLMTYHMNKRTLVMNAHGVRTLNDPL
jgi:hypothetical protein